jgi:hypothetical protein
VRLLREMGYSNARYYQGGLENWTRHGLKLVTGPADDHRARTTPASHAGAATPPDAGKSSTPPRPVPPATDAEPARAPLAPAVAGAPDRRGRADVLADRLNDLTVARVFTIWLGVIVLFGVIYWLAGSLGANALRAGREPTSGGWAGLGEALYFSFVTALSIGYGDVVPHGWTRVLAILEATCGLILFGVLISKLVSRRQEALTDDLHRIAFDERLGRVRVNLHLVLTELQAIAVAARAGAGGADRDRVASRLESAAAVFAGELTTVHGILHNPERKPPEQPLGAILTSLASAMEELHNVLKALPDEARTDALRSHLQSIARLGDGICGDCVPPEYAPGLEAWMDRVRELSRGVE